MYVRCTYHNDIFDLIGCEVELVLLGLVKFEKYIDKIFLRFFILINIGLTFDLVVVDDALKNLSELVSHLLHRRYCSSDVAKKSE